MNTAEYLDALRIKLELPSDYALQKVLGVTKQQVSRYRKGIDTFSDEVALRVAELLKKDAGLVLLDMHRERAKTPETKAVWSTLAEKFSLGFDDLIRHSNPRYA